MYQTYCNGKQYCFYEDRLCVNNAVIPYEMISNIKHRSGDAPAFLFEYGGRQFALPYPPGELPQILPYMKIASQTLPPLENVEPFPAQDMAPAPAFAEPPVTEQAVADPFAANPAYAEPMVDESFPDPMVADSAAEDMYVEAPTVAEPFASDPAYAEPMVAEPAVTDPAFVEPAVTNPVFNEQAVADVAPVREDPAPREDAWQAPPSPPKGNKKKVLLILACIFAALLIAFGVWFIVFGGGDEEEDYDYSEDTDTMEEYVEPEDIEPGAQPMPEPGVDSGDGSDTGSDAETGSDAGAASGSDEELNSEEQSAYDSALVYLNSSGFSRSGLIQQLEFDNYPSDVCEKAVSTIEENGEVNWKKECLEAAKTHMGYSSFSKQEMIGQLEYEGFTDDQINSIIDEVYR